ncbi:MAG TPA: prepilin-type N-terminal cleavage/methylation domain-containing protein [Deltaproteobacteria bacterium]|nr:prepilin-type N-terminal cleavage/methylation domain-containing protein [Deltaproteobacteria bacterium]
MKRLMVLANSKGLTLIELMIVLVLSLLLMGAVFMTFQLQHNSSRAQTQVAATQQDLRAAMDVIAMDIMHAGLCQNPSSSIQGIPTGTSGTNTLQLQMDYNDDGATTGTGELVTYRLNNGNLERVDVNAGVTQVIARNVTVLTFQYLGRTKSNSTQQIDPGGGTLSQAQAKAVRFIDVTITKEGEQVDSQTGNAVQRTLSRWVCRRNGAIDEL